MFLISFFQGTQWFDKQLFMVDVEAMWLAFGLWAIMLMVVVPYLANIPQPVPNWRADR